LAATGLAGARLAGPGLAGLALGGATLRGAWLAPVPAGAAPPRAGGAPAPAARPRPPSAAGRPRPASRSKNGSWPPPPWRTAWQAGPWTGPQALWRSHIPAGCSTRSHFLVITRTGRRLARRPAPHSI